MTRDDATALLAALPDVSSSRAKRFATEVATRYPATSSGMGLVLPPLVIGKPPAWSPDAAPPPVHSAVPVGNPFDDFVPTTAPATPASAASSWWPPSPTALKGGVAVLALGAFVWAVFFRRRGATAAAPAPIVVVTGSGQSSSPVKTNRGRFTKGAR